jgi:ribonuclease P protein component
LLPPANRLRHATEFATVIRRGERVRRGHVVVHLLGAAGDTSAVPTAPTAGFVVGRSVGGSVERHRVSRRLRAQLRLRLDRLPAGSATVVRALPGAESDTSARLGADLDAALGRLLVGAS